MKIFIGIGQKIGIYEIFFLTIKKEKYEY